MFVDRTGAWLAGWYPAPRGLIQRGALGIPVEQSFRLLEHRRPPAVCGSPQIVEGFGLRGVRDGRCGGLLVVDG